jgi:glycosyltransferase involved in cell wall biosynthesis
MRIAILTNDYSPQTRGGCGVVAEMQARVLKQRGHEIQTFVSDPGLEKRSPWRRLYFHWRDLSARQDLVQRILDWNPEILLTHNLTGCGWATPQTVCRKAWLAQSGAKKIVWAHVLHDVQLFEPSGKILAHESWRLARKIWRKFWVRSRRRALGMSNIVFSPTVWLLDLHKKYGFFQTAKTFILPNPISQVTSVVPGSGVPEILYVGRLDPDKGFQILVEAWEKLGRDKPRLRVVGQGELVRELPIFRAQDPNFIYCGSLPHEQVLELLKNKPVVVVPSLVCENQPTIILEALAADCRVIASEVGGIPETLDSAGWLVAAGDVEALAIALKRALGTQIIDPQTERARQNILERHGVEAVVDELESILKSNL